jgi:hypothetical protein
MKSLSSKTYQCGVTIQGLTTLSGTVYLTGITNTASWDHVIVGTTAQGQIYTRTYAQFMGDVATGISLSSYVPTSRTLTINGTGYDLSADRSWTITTPFVSKLQHQVKAGVAINKGQAVYVTGADGTNMIVGLASNASEATSSKTMGLLDATVSTNGFANVVTEGLLAGLDTTGATAAGDPVWLGTGGNLIYGLASKPYAPAHLVFIGIVTRRNANNGEIFVKVQNGFELKEIHDVDLFTTTPVNGHILGFDGTLWVNKTVAGWLGYTPANASGTTNYISKFTGSTTLGNSQIFDNGTNVGIGTATPGYKLEVNGTTKITATFGAELSPALTSGNWSTTGGMVVSGSIAYTAGTIATATPVTAITPIVGEWYKVTYTVTGTYNANNVFSFGGTFYSLQLGTNTVYLNATSTAAFQVSALAITNPSFTITALSIVKQTSGTGTLTVDGAVTMNNTLAISSIGIGTGTVTPTAPLQVVDINGNGIRVTRNGVPSQYISIHEAGGAVHTIETVGDKPLRLNNTTSGNFGIEFYTLNTARGQFSSGGNFLLGTAIDSGYKLDVNGTARIQSNALISGSLSVTGSILQNGSALALQDGTILYHTLPWFTPSSTVSSSGTTVTSVGTQFTSAMVGAKLTISGESRIITAFTSTTQVTVASAYSVNYSGIAAGSWGVYSKVIEITANQYNYFAIYDSFGVLNTRTDGTQFYIKNYRTLNNNVNIIDTGVVLGGTRSLAWTNNLTGVNEVGGANDIALRRNAAGILEVYNGTTADGTLANRRDLLLRNLTGLSATFNGSITAASAIARGTYLNNTLVAAANNDVLVGLDVAPTFTNGAFTGIRNVAIRTSGGIVPSTSAGASLGEPSFNFNQLHVRQIQSSGSSGFEFYPSYTTKSAQWFTTGNLLLQNGGTFTDAGYKLDVTGTLRTTDSAYFATTSGSVGIGTTSPSTKLHVVGASIIANNSSINPDTYGNTVIAGAIGTVGGWGLSSAIGGNAGTGHSWAIGTNGDNLYMGYSNGSSSNSMLTFLQVDDSTRNVFLVPQAGNVGIGTASPSYKLDVSGALRATGTVYSDNGSLAGSLNLGQVVSIGSSFGSYANLIFTMHNGGGFSDILKLQGNGNVGIGTNSPTKKLHVYTADNEGIFLQGTGGGVWMDIQAAGGQLHSIGAQVGGMGVYNRTSNLYRMFITDAGNFGIGNTSPSTLLDVSGVITATGGNSTNWNTAYSWGNHSSAGYVPQARTLTINGTSYDLSANRSWTIATTTPGGSDTQFQYNSSGSLAGASALTYNSTTNRVGINQASPGYDLDVNGQVRVQDKLRVGTVNSGNGVVHMSSTATINANTTTIVWAQNVSVGMCAFIEYYILNNNSLTDQRAGTIMVTWNQSGTPTITHTETTTPDIGSTVTVNFTSSLVGSDARINAVNSSANPYTMVMSYKYF